jgi:hypothetical protein
MAVRVSKVHRLGWHPLVQDRTCNRNATLSQGSHNVFYIGFINGEGKMLSRPFPLIFLEHKHSCLAACP